MEKYEALVSLNVAALQLLSTRTRLGSNDDIVVAASEIATKLHDEIIKELAA